MALTHFNSMICFAIESKEGDVRELELPSDLNLSLMEVLKASEYPIEGTCGGMALCATCHIEVLKGVGQLGDPTDSELDMLDTLPSTTPLSRLACQIRINPRLQDTVLKLTS